MQNKSLQTNLKQNFRLGYGYTLKKGDSIFISRSMRFYRQVHTRKHTLEKDKKTHTHSQSLLHTLTHTRSQAHTNTHTKTHTLYLFYTHTQTHANTHTHTLPLIFEICLAT